MTLTRREKKLVYVFLIVLLFALVLVMFFLPENQKRLELAAAEERLNVEYTQVKNLTEDTTMVVDLETQQKIAQKNYQYFYSELNSYTIDGIINTLIQKNGLFVKSLMISPYEDATFDFPLQEEADNEAESTVYEGVLVKSTVHVTVTGTYANMLRFMDNLNEKSTCLRIDTVTINENSADATGLEATSGDFRIYIYGINVKPESIVVDTN